MPQATITARWVNPPKEGKKLGTIKTDTNELYGVYPEMLSKFQQNGIYEVEYTERTFDDGRTFKTIKAVAPKGMAPRPVGGRPMAPRETSMKDAERMFVCSILNAGVQAGKLEFNRAALETAVNGLRQVWAETFGAHEVGP
jgi:hypothetical protein